MRGLSWIGASLLLGLLSWNAEAQIPNPMPTTSTIDENGVDLTNWSFSYQVTSIALGPVELGIYYPSDRDSFSATLRIEDSSGQYSNRATATAGNQTWVFITGGSAEDPGASLGENRYIPSGGYIATVVARDGTVIDYDYPSWYIPGNTTNPMTLCARSITRPDGEVLTYYAKYNMFPCRIQSIVSNRGYQIKYDYVAPNSIYRSRITLINNAFEYCNPTADTCNLTMNWPYISLSSNPRSYTNHSGQVWNVIAHGIIPPGHSSPTISWTAQNYISPNVVGNFAWRVTSATRDGGTWLYTYPSSDPLLGGVSDQLLRVQDPLGNVTRFRRLPGATGGDASIGEFANPSRLIGSVDQLGNVSTYGYNSSYQVTAINLPEGRGHLATYDYRGNILTYTQRPKTGSGAANLTTTYTYGAFNDRPLTVTDPNGNVTEYTYDPVHSGVLTEARPAPSPGAPRPVTRYAYAQRYAWIRNSSGSYVQAASPIWVLDTEKTCRTSATVAGACAAGSSDEVTVTYDYGPNSGPNNLWLRGRVETADGVSRRTCYAYDPTGNRISETQPNAGLTSCP